jgi:hypothetical protein
MDAATVLDIPINSPLVSSRQWEPVSVVYDMPQLLRQMFDRLTKLAELPENWDGYGSPRLQPSAMETASDLLVMLSHLRMPMPHFAPVSGGGLQLEWQRDKKELELEILPSGEVSFLIVDDTGQMLEGTLPRHLSPGIKRLAGWFKE